MTSNANTVGFANSPFFWDTLCFYRTFFEETKKKVKKAGAELCQAKVKQGVIFEVIVKYRS